MIYKLRQRMASDDSGFTLVELLVVMLIIGLLAAIAIPSFFNQRDKAKDSSAKEAVRTAQTAMETFATDNGGSYVGGDADGALTDIEGSLTDADLTVPSVAAKSYKVSVTADDTGTVFSITRASTGGLTYTCAAGGTTGSETGGPGTGGCPDDSNWN